MKILGIVGSLDTPLSHDGSVALIIDNKIVYAIEQERLSRNRYALEEGASDAVRACLRDTGLQLSDIDYIAYGWLSEPHRGINLSDKLNVSNERDDIILPTEMFDAKHPPLIHFVQHHYAHAASAYYTSGFDSAAVLVVDARGEGESTSLYHAKGNKMEFIKSYPTMYSLGNFYSAAGTVAGLGGKSGHSGPGKLMGLAPFGSVRQEIDLFFDSDTGVFTLPPSIQKKMDALQGLPTTGHVWKAWLAYFEDHFYPFAGQKRATSLAYDVMHYVDLAASVQQKLENICQGLVEHIKKLTGEDNLVLSGGCALNCSMNAHISRQNTFKNVYVFPGANDAGCSIGAALAVSNYIQPFTKTLPRLDAPDFGTAYTDEEIAAVISDYGFTPYKLSPNELAERVADDLANDKIIAWFRGRDEFGPRALGRRSFMANPTNRENMGRLNRIKGREMWRPLAPSILDEHAETVLEGTMERGLHRYMLGVATIRKAWLAKIPGVVHIDFTCRPHFVQQENDGLYWAVIQAFYNKTGVPLVCNTSLNVAGQPIVHTPQEVLEVFIHQDDVQTLVIEGFYLTKNSEAIVEAFSERKHDFAV